VRKFADCKGIIRIAASKIRKLPCEEIIKILR